MIGDGSRVTGGWRCARRPIAAPPPRVRSCPISDSDCFRFLPLVKPLDPNSYSGRELKCDELSAELSWEIHVSSI